MLVVGFKSREMDGGEILAIRAGLGLGVILGGSLSSFSRTVHLFHCVINKAFYIVYVFTH